MEQFLIRNQDCLSGKSNIEKILQLPVFKLLIFRVWQFLYYSFAEHKT